MELMLIEQCIVRYWKSKITVQLKGQKQSFSKNSLNDFKFMPFLLYNIRHLPAFGNLLKGMIKVRHISNALSTNSL